MRYGILDIGYRAPGQTVPVLVNPYEARELDDFCKGFRPIVRFSLNSGGIIWFGRAMECLHGDEFSGTLVVEKKNEAVRDILEAPRLVSGVLWLNRSGWLCRLFSEVSWSPWRGNEGPPHLEPKLLSERAVLTSFSAWSKPLEGIDITWLNGMTWDEITELVDPRDLD